MSHWIIKTLQKRKDWVEARCALREDVGEAGYFDRQEGTALGIAIARLKDYDRIQGRMAGLEIRLANQLEEIRNLRKALERRSEP